MSFKYKEDKVINAHTSGSVVVETAVIIPVILFFILLFVRLLQVIVLQNCVERATLQTAKLLSQYAVLYHAYGMVTLEESVLEELDASQIENFVDLRGYIRAGENALYSEAAEVFLNYYLKQDKLVKNGYVQYEDLSCKDSTFFMGNDDITLSVSCKAYHLLPVGTTLRFRGWVRGDSPLSSLMQSGVSVWSFDNFTRGKMIRDIFGGDLPYDYPVIASFKDGVALMIKSIDTTKPTYQNASNLQREIEEMADKLHTFQGVPGEIETEAIRTKKILLVVPENTAPEQLNVLFEEIRLQGVNRQIQMEVQFFQESCN